MTHAGSVPFACEMRSGKAASEVSSLPPEPPAAAIGARAVNTGAGAGVATAGAGAGAGTGAGAGVGSTGFTGSGAATGSDTTSCVQTSTLKRASAADAFSAYEHRQQ